MTRGKRKGASPVSALPVPRVRIPVADADSGEDVSTPPHPYTPSTPNADATPALARKRRPRFVF